MTTTAPRRPIRYCAQHSSSSIEGERVGRHRKPEWLRKSSRKSKVRR